MIEISEVYPIENDSHYPPQGGHLFTQTARTSCSLVIINRVAAV